MCTGTHIAEFSLERHCEVTVCEITVCEITVCEITV